MPQLYRFSRRSALRGLVVAAALCLPQVPALAQAGLIVGLVRTAANVTLLATADYNFVRKGKGSYQLASEAAWQPSEQLVLSGWGLQVGRKDAQAYNLEQLSQVVLYADTFAVVQSVEFPKPAKAKPTDNTGPVTVVARRVWRRPQVELLEFASAAGPVPVLRFPNQRAVALPTKRKEFQQAMLAVVGDHPGLANQLRTNQLDASHTRQILEFYLKTKPEGFALMTAPAGQ
jgi:hypothetical protein